MTSGRFVATTLIGFDSAWADRPKAPGAICALAFDEAGHAAFEPPTLVGFDAAAAFVAARHGSRHRTLVAIDQPTIVPNQRRARPCERVVASVMSWSGGGIQPDYRDKATMFGDGAPIWRFLDRLSFVDDPEQARLAKAGGFVMEVFPALALLSLAPRFAVARGGPRYNPARPTFRQEAWRAVCDATARAARRLGFDRVAAWCDALDRAAKPGKAAQDKLDSVICLIVAAVWLADRTACAMVGDLSAGYVVAPTTPAIRIRLREAAAPRNVAVT